MTGEIGTVLAVQANFYRVRLDRGETLLCTRRALLKKIGQTVMVGDRVRVESGETEDERGAIVEVLDRKSQIDRPKVANADRILLVFAIEDPPLEAWQLSRFLVKAESSSLPTLLCLNKIDLVGEGDIENWRRRLNTWGYEPILVSTTENRGMEVLLERLTDRLTLFAGPSGAGKSSLINLLSEEGGQRTGSVSGKLRKGRHTTRHVELFPLKTGGTIADTPGFNQPDLDCRPEELSLYFPEIRRRLKEGSCQFNDCSHRDEPNCRVRGDWERYEHYRQFLEEANERENNLQKTATAEAAFKKKTRADGRTGYEPRLENKKYRRPSRRQNVQNLKEDYE